MTTNETTKFEEESRQHLQFVQDIITRMNRNSFQIKGWSVTLVAALFALAAAMKNPAFFWGALLPVLVFWYLDAIFLHQEKYFRRLYEEIVKGTVECYTMQLPATIEAPPSPPRLMFSKTFWPFHGILFFLTFVLGLGFYCGWLQMASQPI